MAFLASSVVRRVRRNLKRRLECAGCDAAEVAELFQIKTARVFATLCFAPWLFADSEMTTAFASVTA